PRPTFPSGNVWEIGEPDLVVKYPTFTVPATGPDLYGSLYAPFNLKEDRYIKAIQSRPVGELARQVDHTALSFPIDHGLVDSSWSPDDATGGQQFLVEYASGKSAEFYPDDTGVLLKAGQNARLSYHLHSVGEEVKADFELGISLYPKGVVPKHVRWSKQLVQHQTALDLAPGEITRVDGYERLNKAAVLTAFQPHMHIRGKHHCLVLIYPTLPVSTDT